MVKSVTGEDARLPTNTDGATGEVGSSSPRTLMERRARTPVSHKPQTLMERRARTPVSPQTTNT